MNEVEQLKEERAEIVQISKDEVKRLKAQRSEIVRIVKEMWDQSYQRLTEEHGGRFQEGGLAYMMTLDRKLKVLIKSGKTTMAEANDHQRSMNPNWEDA